MYDHAGNEVSATEVLDEEELLAYYEANGIQWRH